MAIEKILLDRLGKRIGNYAYKFEKILREEVHSNSGALRDGIKTEKKGTGDYLVGVDPQILKADPRNAGGIDYSEFYYFGHKAYTIYPKTAKALSWIGKDGVRRFAKYVKIPASAGDDFIGRAMKRRPKI